MLKKFTRSSLDQGIDDLLARGVHIEAPVAKREAFVFAPIQTSAQVRLDYDVTILPPKKYFIPQRETLFTHSRQAGYEPQFQADPFILLGVHPYDMIGISQLDLLFSQDFCDTHYLARRESATIIALDVITPSKDVFAASMGMAIVHDGFDVLLTSLDDDSFLAECKTQKGSVFLDSFVGIDACDIDLAKRRQVWARNKQLLNKHPLKCRPEDIPGLLERGWDHPVWEEKAKTCFSCGSCNNVCPTCYCFDIREDFDWHPPHTSRSRCWDLCQLRDFTRVSGGHVFRKTATQRFRHRLYRKGKYVPDRIGGQMSCVGCGRCVHSCLPDIANPARVYNRLFDDLGAGGRA